MSIQIFIRWLARTFMLQTSMRAGTLPRDEHNLSCYYRIKAFLLLGVFLSVNLFGQDASIVVDLNSQGAKVSSSLHGIFFEEISHGGEGGLYAELIQNRGFEESRVPQGCKLDSGWIIPPRTPHFSAKRVIDWKMRWEPTSPYPAWSLQMTGRSQATVMLDTINPLNPATPRSLKVDIYATDASGKVSVVNDGFWGIRVDKSASYSLTFYLRTEKYKGDVTASLVSGDGKILATQVFKNTTGSNWQKLTGTLKATASDAKAKFHLSFSGKGTLWLDFVSLFPAKTFRNRPNGMRADLANYLADLKPAFIRWPGGCFVEGISTESAPNWKRSLGPPEERYGTYSPWGYWSNDGIGYHEFLQFCEDIGADAMYVFNCGVSCEMRSGVYESDERVPYIINDILEGIEYAIGPADSKWGAVRAKNGHPAPFPLKYIEVGNEQAGPRYGERFNIFYKAIKEKYPALEVIASMGISHVNKSTVNAITKMDIADEHAYKAAYWPMIYHDWYDRYERKDWKLYVGEYACNAGVGSGNMLAALNDATFILGMERNADLITMSSYAPLLENINDTDWPVNLIRFDNAHSFARISYYAIRMLNEHKATVNLATRVTIDTATIKPAPAHRGAIGLSTWDTQAEFKDIQIFQEGKVVYRADFIDKEKEWATAGGKWQINDGAIAQTTEGAWPMAVLKDSTWDTYTLKLKARKTGGVNAFMIPFAIRDSINYLRAHIGAWVNRVAAFEMVTKGADAMVTQPVTLEKPIEINRWYDIELRVGTQTVECYLDGKLLMTYREPKRFFSIAGKDEKTNEIVIKVVNAKATPQNTSIQLKGLNATRATARAIILSAPDDNAENSFEHPTRFIPREEKVEGVRALFNYTFKAWSITILRIKE